MKYIVTNKDLTTTEYVLHYVSGTYKPPHVSGDRFIQFNVIPSPGNTSFETVIQGAPRGRKKTNMRLFFETYEEFLVFHELYNMSKKGKLILPENYEFNCVISNISEPEGHPFGVQVDVIFIEV